MTAKEKVEETNKKQVKNFIKNSGKSKREERLRQRKQLICITSLAQAVRRDGKYVDAVSQ